MVKTNINVISIHQ